MHSNLEVQKAVIKYRFSKKDRMYILLSRLPAPPHGMCNDLFISSAWGIDAIRISNAFGVKLGESKSFSKRLGNVDDAEKLLAREARPIGISRNTAVNIMYKLNQGAEVTVEFFLAPMRQT